MKRGFTLIELLVVVLIIGILSAIALPQYQKAVAKARAAEAISMLSSLEKAVSVWVLANGYTSANFLGGSDLRNANLDIEIPSCEPGGSNAVDCQSSSDIFYYAECYTSGCEISASGGIGNEWYLMFSFMNTSGNWYLRKCGYHGSNAKAICDSLVAQGWEAEEDWEN